LYAKFGTADVQGYRALLAERDELLVKVAGDAAKSFVQRHEPRKRIETAPTRDTTGVYVFGPMLPAEGYAVPSVEQAIENFRRYGLIDPQTHDRAGLLDQLVRAGYTLFIKNQQGDVEVFGKVPIRTTPEGRDDAMEYLGLETHESVQHRSTPTARPVLTQVGHVL
jgi:hypothetical protein